MDVRLPDGTIVTNVPEGTTQSELISRVSKARGTSLPAMPGSVASPAEVVAGSAPTRFALGAAAPVLAAGQVVDEARKGLGLPDWLRPELAIAAERIKPMVEAGRKEIGSTGVDWAEMGGAALGPASLAAAKLAPAATYAGKVAQGAGIGAGFGAATPATQGEDFWSQKAAQTGAGAALGGFLAAIAPLVQKGGVAAYRALIEPWANPAAIKGRAFLDAAGDKADELIALLRQNRQIVPGGQASAGEVAAPAGSAEFSALQRSASNVKPSLYQAQADAQNAARIAAVKTVGQDETAIKAAEAARSQAAGPLYQAARSGASPIDTKPIVQYVDTVMAQNPGNRELVREFANIKAGLTDEAGNLRTNAQEVASVLDGLKAALANKDNAFIKGQLTNVKNQLVRAIPNMTEAQAKFAEMSAPVNQMEIGQYLEKKLVPALSDEAKQKAATFANAVQDAAGTVKRATGEPRFEKLSQALTADQLAAVNSVRDDLARGARFDQLATRGSKAAPDAVKLATQSMEATTGGPVRLGILQRGAMIMNSVIARAEGKINKRLASEIAIEMLNPPQVGESLSAAQARAAQNRMWANAIEQYKLPSIGFAAHESAQQQGR